MGRYELGIRRASLVCEAASLLLSLAFFCSNTISATGELLKVPLEMSITEEAGHLKQPVSSYFAKTLIGTPGKKFNIALDLDFNDLFVTHTSNIGERIIGDTSLPHERGYRGKDSKSYRKIDELTKVKYGDCRIEGKIYWDLIRFSEAGGSFNQSFLGAKRANCKKFTKLPFEGVFGLSLAKNARGQHSLLETLKQKKFSLSLRPNGSGSEFLLGGPQEGVLNWLPVSAKQPENWAVDLSEVKIGARSLGCRRCHAVLSSLETDLFGPADIVKEISAIFTLQDKNGLKVMPCSRLEGLKVGDLSFELADEKHGDQRITLKVEDYIRNLRPSKKTKGDFCYLAIHPLEGSKDMWILGTAFLSRLSMAHFDLEQKRLALVV